MTTIKYDNQGDAISREGPGDSLAFIAPAYDFNSRRA
jgi:hypothetical protein